MKTDSLLAANNDSAQESVPESGSRTCESDSHTIVLRLSYDGSPFSGFARQNGQVTVQGELEKALELLYRRPIETVCAGRTDAGVHARSQVVSFDLTQAELESRSLASLLRSLNGIVDDHIAITRAAHAPQGFSARFDAVEREYRYFISEEAARPVLLAHRVWHVRHPLDLEAMREGAQYLIGEHDFKSFCISASALGKPTSRFVREISIECERVLGEAVIVVRVLGNAFLHSMVRTIVGTLVAVGEGKRPAHWVDEVLRARDRRVAGQTAPAEGLIFWRVRYPEGLVDDLFAGEEDL